MKKASIESLLEMKLKNEKDSVRTVEVKSLGMEFTINKLPITQLLRIMDDYDDTSYGQFEMFKEIVYMCIPIFRDKKLTEACECTIPHDIVTVVLGEDMNVIQELGTIIMGMYNIDKDAVEQIKN
jgi:hypothetical protein